MPKTKISEWSATPANNTDIDGINIAEGCPPSSINDAIREMMSQVKDLYAGTSGDIIAVAAGGTGVGTSTGSGSNVLSTSPTLVTPALGTPSALVGTNITGTATSFNINGTVGATTPTTGAFTTLAASGNVTLSGGTANGVAYLNGSKVVTSGSALVFDGTNLGLGVTPSAWESGFKAIDIGIASALFSSGSGQPVLSYNAYYNSGDKYKGTGLASAYEQAIGQHRWYTAPSGTAGNAITFTQAMTLDASGNLLVGTTSGANKLEVASAGSVTSAIRATTAGSIASPKTMKLSFVGVAGDGVTAQEKAYVSAIDQTTNTMSSYLAFGVNASGTVSEAARIDSSGNLIQTVNTTAATLSTNGTLTFSIVNNSTLRISVRGSDGTTRTATIALT